MAKKRKGSMAEQKMRMGWILLIAFLVLLLLVLKIDVRPIGPENSEVGLAFLNGPVHDLLGFKKIPYTISKLSGALTLLAAAGFAVLGVLQLVQRRSLFEVDRDILLLGAFYVLTLILYIFFDKVPINYRPIILDEGLEPSFPSTHSMLALVICGTGMMQVDRRLKGSPYKGIAIDVLGILMIITVLCRLDPDDHYSALPPALRCSLVHGYPGGSAARRVSGLLLRGTGGAVLRRKQERQKVLQQNPRIFHADPLRGPVCGNRVL